MMYRAKIAGPLFVPLLYMTVHSFHPPLKLCGDQIRNSLDCTHDAVGAS